MTARPRRGVALVAVLCTVAILATVTAMASHAARSSAAVTANARAQAMARAMAESGIVAATSAINDSLRAYATDATRRDNYLSQLEPQRDGALPFTQDALGSGVFAVTVVDVSARLDVNAAGAEGLATLFGTVTTPEQARLMGQRIDAYVRGEPGPDDRALERRDSLNAALLGRDPGPRLRRAIESLETLREIPGVDADVLARVAALMTVDGDGRTNRRGASREVLAAATGTMVDAPSRLLLISRGWLDGHPLTRQIEAVYDIADDGLRLVRWREFDR